MEVVATILKNVRESMQKWNVVINLMIYSMLSIMITPVMDSVQGYIENGIFDSTPIVDVSKVILAPFFMLIAFKQIVSEINTENRQKAEDLNEAYNKINELNNKILSMESEAKLMAEHSKFTHDVQVKQMEGVIGIKEYEIKKLNEEIDRLKAELKLTQNGIIHKGGSL